MSSTTATGLATTDESAQAQPRHALSFTFDDGPDETWTPRVLEQLLQLDTADAQGQLADGGAVLMHDAIGPGALRAGCQNTIALLPALAAAARADGLALAPMQPPAISPPAIEVPA